MDVPSNPHRSALAQYRRRAAVYDVELVLFEPIRRTAVARLGLRPGDCVLDVGCGTGLSLPLLQAAIGPTGRIVGIEQSPEMMARARERVVDSDWQNVTLIEASAEDAALAAGAADAALFHFTHDVLQSPTALANTFAAVRPEGRIVASGLQWSAPWLWPVNLFVLGAALHSMSSLAGLAQPWSLLTTRLTGLRIDQLAAGAVYVASGSHRGAPPPGPRQPGPR